MSKNVLLRATKLVESLSPREKIAVINFINSTRKENSKQSKLLDLFMDLDQGRVVKDSNRKLVELLEDRVLDCLFMDINLLHEGKYKNNKQVSLAFEKESIKSRLLLSKGVVKRSFDVAQNCLKRAKRSENFDTILMLLNQQIALISFHRQEEDFFKKVAEIDYYENCRTIKIKAVRIYRELCLKKYHGITENLDLFVDANLKQLREFAKKATFPTLDFITVYFQKEKHELEGKLHEALDCTVSLYAIWEENPDSPLIYNIYELVYEQAGLVLELGRKEEAIFLLEKCVNNLPVENVACQKAHELLFLLQYTARDLISAHQTLITLKSSVYYDRYILPEQKGMWSYYEACLYFNTGNHRKCADLLLIAETAGLEATGRIRMRLLSIMAHIEMEKLDEADKQLEAIRRYIRRNQLNHMLRGTGINTFYTCLLSLKQVGYDFSRLRSVLPDLCDKLEHIRLSQQQNDKLSSWLVEYAVWFEDKLNCSEEPPNYAFEQWETGVGQHFYETGTVKRIGLI